MNTRPNKHKNRPSKDVIRYFPSRTLIRLRSPEARGKKIVTQAWQRLRRKMMAKKALLRFRKAMRAAGIEVRTDE